MQLPATATAEAIISASLLSQLASAGSWTDLSTSAALKPFNNNWLERRRQHLIFAHIISEHGLPTHFENLVQADGTIISPEEAAGSNAACHLKVQDTHHPDVQPVTLNNQSVYYYPPPELSSNSQTVPLDVYFHFGLPQGSLLSQRLQQDPGYGKRLGLDKPPIALSWFERPVLEYSARFEHSKRICNLQEALLISGLTAGQFEEMIETSYNAALALQVAFRQADLILWAGKLQYAISKEGLLLTSTLSPREMVLGYADLLLPGSDLPQILHSQPPAKDDLIMTSYKIMANQLTGQELFSNLPSLPELAQRLRQII